MNKGVGISDKASTSSKTYGGNAFVALTDIDEEHQIESREGDNQKMDKQHIEKENLVL